jgi:hypothetical protein
LSERGEVLTMIRLTLGGRAGAENDSRIFQVKSTR